MFCGNRRTPTSMKVLFSASGYGTKRYNFKNREELMEDVNGTAAEHDGDVQDYGDEIVVTEKDGDEIATWIIC